MSAEVDPFRHLPSCLIRLQAEFDLAEDHEERIPYPIRAWENTDCDCKLGNRVFDLWAHYDRHCRKATVYLKASERYGLPLQRGEM